jgi:hypothetical protein
MTIINDKLENGPTNKEAASKKGIKEWYQKKGTFYKSLFYF